MCHLKRRYLSLAWNLARKNCRINTPAHFPAASARTKERFYVTDLVRVPHERLDQHVPQDHPHLWKQQKCVLPSSINLPFPFTSFDCMQNRGTITRIARGYLVVGEVVYYWSGMEEVDYVLFYQDKSAASLCHQVTAWIPDMFCNFYSTENHKNSTTTKAREYINTYVES